MSAARITAFGQLAFPADRRRRLGWLAGTQVELIEASDGVKGIFPRATEASALAACAGMVTAPTRGKPRQHPRAGKRGASRRTC